MTRKAIRGKNEKVSVTLKAEAFCLGMELWKATKEANIELPCPYASKELCRSFHEGVLYAYKQEGSKREKREAVTNDRKGH
jgi:hypothetical protein